MSQKVGLAEELLGRAIDRRFNSRHTLQLLVTRWPRESAAVARDLDGWADHIGNEPTPWQRTLLSSLGLVELLQAALAGQLAEGGSLVDKKGLSPVVAGLRGLVETQLRIADRLAASAPKSTEVVPVDVNSLWADAIRPGATAGTESLHGKENDNED